jgi:NADH-quinone oxidoreductase subunit I
VYEKKDLLIDSQGKYPGYNYYNIAGLAIGGKDKGQAENEEAPVDIRSLVP